MAFSNVDSLNLGNILQIAFSAGIRTQISRAYREWELVNRMRIANTLARELRFMFQSSFGPAAVQFAQPGLTNRSFPQAQQASISENTAKLKEIDVTVEIEHSLWERASKSPEKYAEPLAMEMESKQVAAKRLIASFFYGDGSGVVFQSNGSAPTVDPSAETVTVVALDTTAARGFFGNVQFGDILVPHSTAGARHDVQVASGTIYGYRVKSRVRKTKTVVLEAIDSSGAVLNITGNAGGAPIAASDVWYRVGQVANSDVPDLTASVADYGSFTTVFPGLESLVAADGRKVHGITMSGASAGTVIDCAGALLDVNLVHSGMDEVKINAGEGAYSYKMLAMSPEAQLAFIQSRETDRRFMSSSDGDRGTPKFRYIHRNDALELYVSEFCPTQRIYALPEGTGGQKVIEFWGTDFHTVKGQGIGDFHLKPAATGGGYVNMMVSYMRAYNTLICKHPASILQLKNFVLPA